VLCGHGGAEDVDEMRSLGLEVFSNLTDSELLDFYLAADVYMNFSRWEGYNLGIGQALALGLDVIASDIPAHRAFPIVTSSDTPTILGALSTLGEAAICEAFSASRKPVVVPWEKSLGNLEREILDVCSESESLFYRPKVSRA
jgi:hypothetical protein